MSSVAELAKAQISRIEKLRGEWEECQVKAGKIEAEIDKLCNGHTKMHVVTKRGRPAGGKFNKTEEIRKYHESHPKATVAEIIKALEGKGFSVAYGNVWQAINKPSSGKRGRPKSKEDRPTKESDGGQGRRPEGSRLEDVVMEILGHNKHGLRLKDIVQKVIESGYKTKSSKSTLSASVQNCLGKLRERELISKNPETKCYSAGKAA